MTTGFTVPCGLLRALCTWTTVLSLWTTTAQADATLTHLVNSGESWESIASLYYGDISKAVVLRNENGFKSELPPNMGGLRISIPTASERQVEQGDSWEAIAKRYYDAPDRAFAIIEANRLRANVPPDAGTWILVPYPVHHEVEQGQSLQDIARLYYTGSAAANGAQRLRRFNRIQLRQRVQRGQILLVPLSDLKLSDQGQKFAEEEGYLSQGPGDKREKQLRVAEQLPSLRAHVKKGRYVAAVAMASELLGSGDLSGNQVVTIQRELGTSLVALGEEQMALDAFASALHVQPDMELDMARTSPKVLKIFQQAQAERRAPVVETAPAPPTSP